MKLQEYLNKKRLPQPVYRRSCHRCHRPEAVCLCDLIQPFDTRTRFVILMHPKEARKQKSGTGRLCHLALKNSRLLVGVDFTDDDRVNALIGDPEYRSVLLFPTAEAVDLSQDGYAAGGGSTRRLQIFVVDGTWTLAGKILRLSKNLQALPTVSFTPGRPSNFRIKKQPRAECLSTLESIHLLLQLGQEQDVEAGGDSVDQLLVLFNRLVDIQIECAETGSPSQPSDRSQSICDLPGAMAPVER
ncbi:MAG: tRNA-uridine aminocarboxypropyltransferase [Verrucomicrobiales bacterium]